MNKTMKKMYISPEISTEEMELEGVIATVSPTVDSGDLTNPIETGGEAEGGSSSDSRFGGWFDED